MARGINKVILIGNLGADPEVRYMPNGGAIANLNIATSDSWRDKQTGEKKDRTEWHRVVCFAKLGEIAGEYLRKGAKVYIEGRIQTRKWQDNNGVERYSTEIVANDMQMLDGRGGENTGGEFAGSSNANFGGAAASSPPPQHSQSAPPHSQPAPPKAPGPSQTNQGPTTQIDDFDDDIPF